MVVTKTGENLMKAFAKVILETQRIREESFNHEEADALEKSSANFKNFAGCYKISLYEATNQAARKAGFDKQGTEPIYLLCEYHWDAIQTWAEETLKGEASCNTKENAHDLE